MSKYLMTLCCLFLVFIPVHKAVSQISIKDCGKIKGRIIDSETGQGIPFAHVLNESLRISAISDTSGNYAIHGRVGDTLVFSVLGYLGKYIVLNEGNMSETVVTRLPSRTYDIAEVKVFGYSSYSQFKQEFRRLRLPETETDRLRASLQQIALEIGKEARYQLEMEKAARGGNLLSADILSPEEIQRIKLKEILKEERIQAVIDKKFNRQVVADLTGLKDKELDDFMLFCKLDRQFLLKANQYDILVRVLEKLEEFKQLKGNSGILQNTHTYACRTLFSGYTESPPQDQKVYSCHSRTHLIQPQPPYRCIIVFQV